MIENYWSCYACIPSLIPKSICESPVIQEKVLQGNTWWLMDSTRFLYNGRSFDLWGSPVEKALVLSMRKVLHMHFSWWPCTYPYRPYRNNLIAQLIWAWQKAYITFWNKRGCKFCERFPQRPCPTLPWKVVMKHFPIHSMAFFKTQGFLLFLSPQNRAAEIKTL